MRLVRATQLDAVEEPASGPDDEPVHEADDQQCVAEAIAGDPSAFRRLFERHAPAVRRFLRDLARDGGFADEGTQETFVRAHTRLIALRDDQRLRPWLLGIARRVFLEELRRRRPRPLPGGDERHARSPEADLLIAEEVREFRAALAGLDDDRRGVVLLRLDHGLSYDEIAQVMRMSPARVRNELHRGRQELRDRLAAYREDKP